ncbi:MAG TPA: prepilin peptidase [Gemmatimonadales bacterium]|nr:prepilin peptidase [Gemmatimonadales bacterium]
MAVDPVMVAGAVLVGLCFGSFLNVCILRLPRDQSLLRPRSTCPHCKQPIAWRDNIPLFSWLWLRGKCRWCHAPISKQYPLIEALVGVLFGAAVLAYGMSLEAVKAAVFGSILLGIGITDARHYIIPNEFTWGGLILGLLLALGHGVPGFLDALLGAAGGFALLWIVAMAGAWVFKEEAMGGGDIKMMAMVGSFVGWRGVLLTVFAGAALGSLIFVPLSLKKKRLVPFGVFLAVGAAVTFVFGDAIIGWYGHFLRGD